jgi:hypothetical protein
MQKIKDMEMYFGGRSEVGRRVKTTRVKVFPPLKRGAAIDVYKTTTGRSTG